VALFRLEDREVVGAGALAFGFIAAVMAALALVLAAHADTRVKTANTADTAANAVPVTLKEFSISPKMIDVPLDGKIAVTNAGTVDHNFTIEGTDLKTKDLKPGTTETLDLKA
jgi:predicted homoserine dehydrogenase-like protein